MGITRAGVAQLLAGTSIEVDAIESVVAGKADVADLSALSDRVTSAEETLGTRAEEAATQEALTTLGNRVTSAETAIGAKADAAATAAAIAAKADAATTASAIAAKADAAVTTAAIAAKADRLIASVTYAAASTTLQAADADRSVAIDSALANTLTIPPNTFAVGQVISGTQLGVGRTQFLEGAGVTIRSRLGRYTGGQFAVWTIYQRSANVWELSGDLVSS